MGTCCSAGKAAAPKAGGESQRKLLDKYTLGKVLGQGAFGIVYLCKCKTTRMEYAVKMIDKVETPLAEIQMEAQMLQKLKHPCVVMLHDVYFEKAFVCMVMDLYKGGDMIEGMQLHWRTLGMLPIGVIGNLSQQMIESIEWLHKNSVVHRDVKGDNYLMDRKDIENPQCRIFLSDFGTVREIKEGERLNSKCGTRTYWAPEFFQMNYGLKVDVWALGVVMYGLVTGRFPFKGEEDVKTKKVMVPPRSSKECGELLQKMLEKSESERVSASDALRHRFIASVRKPDSGRAEKLDFKPEVKETGANAAVVQRRLELIGRLEDTQAVGGKSAAVTTLRELKEKTPITVSDKQAEKTSKFEWWPAAKANQHETINIKGARPMPEDDVKNNADASTQEITQMLKDHDIDSSKFGKEKAKTLPEFIMEVQSGASRLMLDAEKHKCLVRVVDVVLLRITCKTQTGTLYLIMSSEQYPDGRTRPDIFQLPGTKKDPYENARETAYRIVKDRLQFNDCKIKFDFAQRETFEEEDLSPSYPGVRTVYRKEIVEGQIFSTDATILTKIGAVGGSGEVRASDSKGYLRTFQWMSEKQCAEKKIKLKALQDVHDFSVLVHPPVGIGEEELKKFLSANNVDVSNFGEGSTKSLKDFSDELVKGEASLIRQPNGRILRVVDVVILKIMQPSGEVLVQVEEITKGRKKSLNWLPAVKRRPDENMFLAAHRVLSKVLKINENFVSINPKDVMIAEEETMSATYSHLPTLYRKRIITAKVVTDGDQS